MTLAEEAKEKRDKLLKLTVEKVGKKRGMMGDDPGLHMDVVSTGIVPFDNMLGNGGFRRGRFVMITGEASMGKTLVTQWIMKAFQDLDLNVGFLDPEKTYESGWFGATGVDVSKLIVVRPSTTEQAFDTAGLWVENGMDLVVIDSLAALTPEVRTQHALTDRDIIGKPAKAINEGLNLLNNKNISSLIIYTNQTRETIGGYGDPTTFTGGKGQKFYASYRLSVSRAGWLGGKDFDKRTGYNVKIRTEKNKTFRPFQTCEIPFYFTGIIDLLAGLLDIAIDLKVIHKAGAWYTYKDERWQGKARMQTWFEENPEEQEELKELIETQELPDDIDEEEMF